MKFVLILVACLGASLAAPKPEVSVSKRSLLADLLGLIELIPLEDEIRILDEHLASDGAVAALIEYLQGSRWNDLLDTVLALPTAVDFIDYLNQQGVPIELLLSALRRVVEDAHPGVPADDSASLRPFLDDVEAILPLDDIVAYLNEQLENDPDLQDLYTTVASEDGKELVDQVLQMEEARYIEQRLTEMGVDVDQVLSDVYNFFGWGAPPK